MQSRLLNPFCVELNVRPAFLFTPQLPVPLLLFIHPSLVILDFVFSGVCKIAFIVVVSSTLHFLFVATLVVKASPFGG